LTSCIGLYSLQDYVESKTHQFGRLLFCLGEMEQLRLQSRLGGHKYCGVFEMYLKRSKKIMVFALFAALTVVSWFFIRSSKFAVEAVYSDKLRFYGRYVCLLGVEYNGFNIMLDDNNVVGINLGNKSYKANDMTVDMLKDLGARKDYDSEWSFAGYGTTSAPQYNLTICFDKRGNPVRLSFWVKKEHGYNVDACPFSFSFGQGEVCKFPIKGKELEKVLGKPELKSSRLDWP
jgi:hypothetical protein